MEKITWKQHMANMEEFKPFVDLLEDSMESETLVKWLYDCPHPDYTSDEFQQAYFKEIAQQLEWFKENTEIKTEPEKTITQTVPGGQYLSYNDD